MTSSWRRKTWQIYFSGSWYISTSIPLSTNISYEMARHALAFGKVVYDKITVKCLCCDRWTNACFCMIYTDFSLSPGWICIPSCECIISSFLKRCIKRCVFESINETRSFVINNITFEIVLCISKYVDIFYQLCAGKFVVSLNLKYFSNLGAYYCVSHHK